MIRPILISTILLMGCKSKFGEGPVEWGPICTVTKIGTETLLTCEEETVIIRDGENGQDGSNGLNGTDGLDGLFVDVIDPCGPQGRLDEVLLVTREGQVLAYFAGSATTSSRLTILEEGVTYITTDGTNCRFKLENGEVKEL